MKTIENIFDNKNRITHQLVRNVALGITLMEIAGAITYVVDGAVTSKFLGITALAANGMTGICFTIFAMISGILAAGVSKICGREIGKGDVEKSGRVFSMALLVTLVISVLVAICGVVFSAQIAEFVGASKNSGELFNYAKAYISGFFIGAPGHILVAMLIPEVQLCGRNKTIIASITVLTVVDIICDFTNVLVLDWGMFGMGLSTTISYYSAVIVLLTCFKNNSLFKISFRKLDFSALPEIIKIGMPRATKRIGNIARPLVINRLILAAGGVVAMSAFSVEQNIRYVVESVGVGIGGSIFILAGLFLGEKDYGMVRSCCKVCIQYIIIAVGLLSVAYFFAAPYITRIYLIPSSESYPWAVQILRCHAVSLPFLAYNEFYQNLVQAEEKYTLTHILILLNKFVVVVVLSFALKPIMGVLGLWMAIPLSEIVLVIAVTIIHGIKNIRNHHPGGFFALLDAYNEDTTKEHIMHISTLNQLEEELDAMKEFCISNNLNHKLSYNLNLFIEEITVLIFEKGLSNTRIQGVDIRVCIDEEEIVVRTRDDGKAISAMEQTELANTYTEDEYLGIEMVYKLSKDLKYITIMNINNFIVTLPLYNESLS